ncbi:MAG: hypothetical protein ACOYNS_12350 [Bacteroidota bacterium]
MKTTMNIDTELNKLQTIRPVDTPPFLYTRIEQRIASRTLASRKLRFAVFSSLLALAIINMVVISSFFEKKNGSSGIQNLASEMNLASSNDLYE